VEEKILSKAKSVNLWGEEEEGAGRVKREKRGIGNEFGGGGKVYRANTDHQWWETKQRKKTSFRTGLKKIEEKGESQSPRRRGQAVGQLNFGGGYHSAEGKKGS